jgi:hypothetical protein
MTTQEENETIRLTPPDIPKASWLIRKCVNGVSKDEVLTTITDIDLFIEILQSNIEALQTYKKVLLVQSPRISRKISVRCLLRYRERR